MLKMFSPSRHSGSSSEYWEETWEKGSGEPAAFCSLDPVRPVIDRYVRPGARLLEGGCGHGHYVVYYEAQGAIAVGVDFAAETLSRVHASQPALRLALGDVARLPFRDGSFDVYYSGGVVEHFESGPDDAIKEARRVLKRDGTLLISVPYLSPMRRLLAPFRREEWKPVSGERVERSPENMAFVQYVYTPREFTRRLVDANLRVVAHRGYAVVWGLQDAGPVRKLISLASRVLSRASNPKPAVDQGGVQENGQHPASTASAIRGVGKRLLVTEDERVPVLGLGLRVLRWFGANMMLYICVAQEEGAPARPHQPVSAPTS